MIYRSTLDPALRMEEKKLITEAGAFILATLAFYLTITPGVLGGFVDYYICLLYTSPSPRDGLLSRMPSSA